MSLADQIAVRLETLPADKLQEVLDFVDFLHMRVKSHESSDEQPFKGVPLSYIEPTVPAVDEKIPCKM
ncbi:MAG TPA: hypothetical protein PK156_10850 [Polyangium sp.]|nr:hypothetical protein [Polyangium sp.]